jgi:hypothetical protein
MATESATVEAQPTAGLSRAAVEEFRLLMQQECGVPLSLEEAWRHATKLVSLYRMLMGPLPEDPAVRTSGTLALPAVDKPGVVE